MKKILLGAVLSGLAASSAVAADIPVKAPPVVPIIFSWSGFYAGGHIGASWNKSDVDYLLPDPTGGAPFSSRTRGICAAPPGVAAVPVLTATNPFDITTACDDSRGFMAGAQIGYNVQNGRMVYGVEADASWRRRLEDTRFIEFGTNTTAGNPMGSVATDTAYFRSEQSALGTWRGRIGVAGGTGVTNWLLYATGGLAVGRVEHQVVEVLSPGTTCVTPGGTTCRVGGNDKTKAGWTVGGGIELALGNQWSVGAEYLYVDLGETTVTLAALPACPRPTSSPTPAPRRSTIARTSRASS